MRRIRLATVAGMLALGVLASACGLPNESDWACSFSMGMACEEDPPDRTDDDGVTQPDDDRVITPDDARELYNPPPREPRPTHERSR